MKRWKMAMFGVLAAALAGLATPVLAETDAERAAKQTAAMELTQMRITYNHARSAIHDVLEAQQSYSLERANKDDLGMREAAAAMIMSLAEARFWMVRLDVQVTESQFGPKIDKDVADLTALVTNAFVGLADELFAGDLNAINKAMDDSANDFNILARTNHNVMTSLWPQLSGAK